MTRSIAIVGLGAMGASMAARLLETGHQVIGYDTLPEARERAIRAGVEVVNDVVSVADASELIILSLPKASFVDDVMAVLGSHLTSGTVVLDTTTSESKTSRAQAAAGTANGYAFLDAPVSGGPSGARTGSMTMIVGGDEAALAKARPVLQHLTSRLLHIGPSGAGNIAKIANNLLCAANLVLVSEMIKLAAKADVSAENLITGINAGSGRSGVSEVNFPKWILNGNYDSGFTMGLMRKDVALAEQLASELSLNLPAMQMIADVWKSSSGTLPDAADFNEIFKHEKKND